MYYFFKSIIHKYCVSGSSSLVWYRYIGTTWCVSFDS